MFLGYGDIKGRRGESRNGSRLESRSGSRLESRSESRLGGAFGEWSSEELNFEMGIIKTTEVIISREGSTWEFEPKST